MNMNYPAPPLDVRPKNPTRYPPYKNNRYFDEFFYHYWQSYELHGLKDKVYYVDVFWCACFIVYGTEKVQQELESWLHQVCEIAEKEGRIPFTICQWDDGILCKKPSNLVLYSMGTTKDVPLPLIVEDVSRTLESQPRIPYHEKQILCSFVGTNTHQVRAIMAHVLQSSGFYIHMYHTWNVDVPKNQLDEFIHVTRNSRFALAPRGYGPSSFRFFEVMKLGAIPIYVHDDENALPFQDCIDYSSFAILVHIRDIHLLPQMLHNISEEQYAAMQLNMEKVAEWFTPLKTSEYIAQDLRKRIG